MLTQSQSVQTGNGYVFYVIWCLGFPSQNAGIILIIAYRAY